MSEAKAERALTRDQTATYEQLAIVEKYEAVVDYLYPILQNCPRKHGVARDEMLKTLFAQVEHLIVAGKSGQPSRLYAADANLATLRFWLRFASSSKLKIMTPRQHRVALTLVAEVGALSCLAVTRMRYALSRMGLRYSPATGWISGSANGASRALLAV